MRRRGRPLEFELEFDELLELEFELLFELEFEELLELEFELELELEFELEFDELLELEFPATRVYVAFSETTISGAAKRSAPTSGVAAWAAETASAAVATVANDVMVIDFFIVVDLQKHLVSCIFSRQPIQQRRG